MLVRRRARRISKCFSAGRNIALFFMFAWSLQAAAPAWATAPTITSFTPTTAAIGKSVTITGAHFSSTASKNTVQFNGAAASVTSASTTQLIATVPGGATSGKISVTVSGATATSSATFTVIPLPTITSFSPTTGAIGAAVTITGTGFDATAANNKVTFNGAAATVASATSMQLIATVPSSASTGLIGVRVNGGPVGYSSSNFTLPPTISGFTPTSGSGSASVTITGTGFSATPANNGVTFNGVGGTTMTSATATQLVVTMPWRASTGPICVQVSGGPQGCSISNFTVVLPTISGFTPVSGLSGTVVTITGTGFDASRAINNYIQFGNAGSAATSATSTQLVLSVPLGATTGPIAVSVDGSPFVSSAGSFTVPLPTITSFTPTSGQLSTNVIITGTNFSSTLAYNTVNFGSATAIVNSATSTQLNVTVPSGASSGTIAVSVNYGPFGYSTSNFTVSPPTITTFTPTSGPGGSLVTITGTGFDTNPDWDIVTFNGTRTWAINSATSTQLVVLLPTTATTGPICVSVGGGAQGCSSSNFTVLPPAITSFSPTSGPMGTSVTITGSGFSSTPANDYLSLGGQHVTVSTATSTQLVFTVPYGASTGNFAVSVYNGPFGYSSSSFTVPLPTITGFTPASGPVGTSVTITGTGFGTTLANNAVKIGGTGASITSATSTQIVATVPAGTVTGPIGVAANGGAFAYTSSNFTMPPPTISGFTPSSGTVGTSVTITGTGFDPTPANDQVAFNGTWTGISAATSTQLTVAVPYAASTGPIGVRVNGSTPVYTSSIFTVPPPTISSFTPISGTAGTSVTITGTGFANTPSGNHVTFNGQLAAVNTAASTQLVVTVPNGATTGPIGVSANGSATVNTTSNFTVPQTTITSFVPASGTVGTEITINGSLLYDGSLAPTVKFNGTPAWVTTASATQVKAIVPTGATTGRITVASTANGAVATSGSNFSVIQPGTGTATVTVTSANGEPSIVNQAYTVSVTVTPASATGTVLVGDQTSSCWIDLLATTCTLNGEPAVGEVGIYATYNGDANFASATSATFAHITNPATATEMCGLDPANVPNDPPGFVPISQLSGIVYTPGIVQDITGNGNLSVTVTSPSANATTADASVDITGTFVGPTNTGITVNGMVASTVNGQFLASAVPLSAGANTLTLTATTLTGATAMTTLNVTQGGTASSPLSFTVDGSTGASGFAPKTVTFDLAIGTLPNNATVQSVAIDPDGSGTYPYTATTLTALPSSFIYSYPSRHTAAFKVIDNQGHTYVAYRTVLIEDHVAQRYVMCDVYSYLKNRLNAQDTTGASNAYQPLVRDKYRSLFTALGNNMPSASTTLGAIADGFMGQGYAEMTLVRDNADQTRSGYPLRMTLGTDGVWRLSEM